MDELMESMKKYKVFTQLRITSLIPTNPNNSKISLKSWPKHAMNMYKGDTKREYNAVISFFIHFYIFMQGTNSVR